MGGRPRDDPNNGVSRKGLYVVCSIVDLKLRVLTENATAKLLTENRTL